MVGPDSAQLPRIRHSATVRMANKNARLVHIINGEPIEMVDCFIFLGMIISNSLGLKQNTDALVKTAQQRLYFLRQQNKFGLMREILVQFYRSAIENIFTL